MNRVRYTPSSPSVYNSLWQNVLLLAAWGTATEIWHIAQKLLVQQAESQVIRVCCWMNPPACNPTRFQQWGFITCCDFQSHLSSPWNHRVVFCPCVSVCACGCCEGESDQVLQELGVSSHGVALHPESFAVCHVLCLGLKSLPGAFSLQIICVMGMFLRMKEFVSQIHRGTLLKLQSNWV